MQLLQLPYHTVALPNKIQAINLDFQRLDRFVLTSCLAFLHFCKNFAHHVLFGAALTVRTEYCKTAPIGVVHALKTFPEGKCIIALAKHQCTY